MPFLRPAQKVEGNENGDRKRFRDNDGLAALLAVQLNADLLMLCTDVDGLYTGNPADPASEYIPTYCPEVRAASGFGHLILGAWVQLQQQFTTHPKAGAACWWVNESAVRAREGCASASLLQGTAGLRPHCCAAAQARLGPGSSGGGWAWLQVHEELISFASKSTNGRGGMMAKVEAAWMAAEQGCSVVILNGKKNDSILQVDQRLFSGGIGAAILADRDSFSSSQTFNEGASKRKQQDAAACW